MHYQILSSEPPLLIIHEPENPTRHSRIFLSICYIIYYNYIYYSFLLKLFIALSNFVVRASSPYNPRTCKFLLNILEFFFRSKLFIALSNFVIRPPYNPRSCSKSILTKHPTIFLSIETIYCTIKSTHINFQSIAYFTLYLYPSLIKPFRVEARAIDTCNLLI